MTEHIHDQLFDALESLNDAHIMIAFGDAETSFSGADLAKLDIDRMQQQIRRIRQKVTQIERDLY